MRTLTPNEVVILLILLRLGLYGFGTYQDKYMPVKYTDIDYLVFSDAARYVYNGLSPYMRATYRYTPLLAWFLVPNVYFADFGKLLFVACDVMTGYLLLRVLQKQYPRTRTTALASIWLLNPMVAQISTRGSLESLLTAVIMLSIYHVMVTRSHAIAGAWLGLAAHLKLYPVIYVPSILLYLGGPSIRQSINPHTVRFSVGFAASVAALTLMMHYQYGQEFWTHSLLYHVVRVDHRHNFSVYNLALYYKSAIPASGAGGGGMLAATLAFVPQFAISVLAIPLLCAKRDLLCALFLQTFLFVTFNKVITSQYFVWFLVLLPAYLARLDLAGQCWRRGTLIFAVWAATQSVWLYFAYRLEFLGQNTFDHGLIYASCLFFLGNCWALGQFIVHSEPQRPRT